MGSLAIPLAKMGAIFLISYILDAMSTNAKRRSEEVGINDAIFYSSDLESVPGKYNNVTYVNVVIYYLIEKMSEIVGHLCSLVGNRLIILFAPNT